MLIAGPTASGKSALAVRLAERLGGVVVNADSMQVYAELTILTARPSAADEARVPHRLYGHVPAARAHSVAEWLADVAPVLAELRAAGRPAIVVGGTGLYFEALTRGLAEVPAIPDEIRAHWRARAAAEGAPALHGELARRDPVGAARLEPGDSQRITRALEVIDATGRPLAAWQAGPRPAPLVRPETALRLIVEPERAVLHARIEARLRQMMGEGAIEEAARFAALGLDPALPATRAIGVSALARVAAGEIDAARGLELAIFETRQYAKRQSTWLRGRMGDWTRVDAAFDQSPSLAALERAGRP
ncbi:tRNA (adenosine(37)-N6)-dimethylallyltransferase MiaA [Siculibacillus lacustris]|uniref:tRNA (adenosine(37)-N6)-dimethylallyltransferase MiaA n=1 Tax=Siculibacillus lacustris TaxID=1549641 RepID=UPI001D1869EA|nr:tRNA (adenosine(37)-N6)-dimethylallyltransferase MiaA [Siculibacillus lacustris]